MGVQFVGAVPTMNLEKFYTQFQNGDNLNKIFNKKNRLIRFIMK